MKHTTLDCYGANEHQLNDMNVVNQLLTDVSYILDVDPICPPCIVPYYYGRVPEDIGISAYVLLEGGHITIHTFPLRECYFIDCFTTKDFDEQKLYDFLQRRLPFDEQNSFVNTSHRVKGTFNVLPYDPVADFGPHLMVEIEVSKEIKMEEMFDFLEKTVYDINMDPITRPYVVKSTVNNPKFLSGITVIAQSHIALHYEYSKNRILADIFSCMAFDYTQIETVLKQLGTIVSNELMARGSKHIYKIKTNTLNERIAASTKWQHVVGRK